MLVLCIQVQLDLLSPEMSADQGESRGVKQTWCLDEELVTSVKCESEVHQFVKHLRVIEPMEVRQA